MHDSPISILNPQPDRSKPWRLWLFLASPIILLMIGLGYCEYGRRTYLPAAVSATDLFHLRLARGEDALIYQEADPAFKARLTEDTEHAFFSRVRRKLGACSYTGPAAWSVTTNHWGTQVRLIYQGRCTNGLVREVLIWRVLDGQKAALMGFSADSSALLTD